MTGYTLPQAIALCERAPRSYRVEYKRDLRPGWGLDWQLHTAGEGHWCIGGREAGAFRSEDAAHAAGQRWVETGRSS